MKTLFLALLVPTVANAALVFTPQKFNVATARALVVIHGCLQSAESMALGTGFNQIAEDHNLIVIYPQVPTGSNPLGCWSWFLPDNQRADKGQLKTVMDEVRSLKAIYKVKGDTFVAGVSSGGAIVSGLIACFPKEFKGAAIHSGPSYALAADASSADRVLKDGPPAAAPKTPCKTKDFTGKLIVIQGEVDPVVNPDHAKRITQDFSGSKSKLVSVPGLDHAWSGYVINLRYSAQVGPASKNPTELPFFSEEGPSATNLIWDYFSAK